MKVTGQQPPLSNKEVATGKVKAQETARDGHSDDVQKSGEQSVKKTLLTDKLKAQVALEPEVRSERVAQLKEQIKDGTYQIDAQDLAGSILLESLREDGS